MPVSKYYDHATGHVFSLTVEHAEQLGYLPWPGEEAKEEGTEEEEEEATKTKKRRRR